MLRKLVLLVLLIGVERSYAVMGILKNTPYELCFTPHGQCTHLIVKTILSAKQSVHVQAYSFTSKPIIKALITDYKKGVKVFVLLDKSNIGMPYAVINALKVNHVPYLIDEKPEIAHNKVMIIDTNTVITGSFNFTKAAQYYYAENVLVLHNQQLAQHYQQNFIKRKADSETINQYCHLITPVNAIMCHQQNVLFEHLKQDHPWRRAWRYLK